MDPGPIPPELHGLTPIEQRLIARYVTYVVVKRLPKGAIGYSGHSIHFKQDIEPMAQQLSANGGRLPRNVEDAGIVVIRKVSHCKPKFPPFHCPPRRWGTMRRSRTETSESGRREESGQTEGIVT